MLQELSKVHYAPIGPLEWYVREILDCALPKPPTPCLINNSFIPIGQLQFWPWGMQESGLAPGKKC